MAIFERCPYRGLKGEKHGKVGGPFSLLYSCSLRVVVVVLLRCTCSVPARAMASTASIPRGTASSLVGFPKPSPHFANSPFSDWLHGSVTCAVTQGPVLRTPCLISMLEILNTF